MLLHMLHTGVILHIPAYLASENWFSSLALQRSGAIQFVKLVLLKASRLYGEGRALTGHGGKKRSFESGRGK